MENNQSSFWQFSDQLRLQSNNLANLSLNDSIWSNSYVASKRAGERRNFDITVGGEVNSANQGSNLKSDFNLNGYNNDGWNKLSYRTNVNDYDTGLGSFGVVSPAAKNAVMDNNTVGGVNLNGGFNKGIYSSSPSMNFNYSKGYNNNNVGLNGKGGLYFGKGGKGIVDFNNSDELGMVHVGKSGKKNNKNQKENTKESNNNNNEGKNSLDKRFKTLPPSEALPRNETIGGYIFVCNNDTMQENLKRQLFGLPPRYRDSVRAITPGLPLFLYNYSTHQLHGVFEAASFGGTNIDPSAWEDKKNPGESRFPAQVCINAVSCPTIFITSWISFHLISYSSEIA
ncbi:OLC1v1028928C1 [Oldenlandia corymbosa var. corymbosa]|uniref:OLC1v1028928C1 n=1 Tax=Oldenlandia corymbosa var. corymbosa TaxID=529605 RepID=A0AAV1CD97_OLDCO|nr:OLC1v1028928C1 [Oldenlandia corymbosa var. corymbosa]